MKNIEDIIRSKKFEELTSNELELIKDLTANEEEFIQMKQFLLSVATISQTETIQPSVKGNLDAIFNSKFQLPHTEAVYKSAVPKIIPFYNTLWFRAAAIFIIGIGIATPIILKNSSTFESAQAVAQLELKSSEESNSSQSIGDKKSTSNSSNVSSKENENNSSTTTSNSVNSDNLNSDNSSRSFAENTTKTISNGKTKRTHELAGLPMYVRKNKSGGFVYSTGANPSTTGLVASSSATTSTYSFVSDISSSSLKDFEITAQPETTDQMLDIIQAVY